MQCENYFQALPCLQRIKQNLDWEMKFFKQATFIRYVIVSYQN